jgi:methyltransferase (TIGR00027 family)
MNEPKPTSPAIGNGLTDTNPQITADALIDLRLHHPLSKRQQLLCPHDQLFWTAAGRDLAMLAMTLDPVYASFNIVRYKWFTERLLRAAGEVPQILLLGAGFDSRAFALPQLNDGTLQLFEVDLPDKIATKLDVFARHRIQLPLGLRHLGADLGDPLLKAKLKTAGFRRDLPTAVLMEGASFFLPRNTLEDLIDPRGLGLASGSALVMDVWTRSRQAALNAKVTERLGHGLFGDSPLGDNMAEIALYAQDHGYGDIEVIALDRLCQRYGIATEADPLPQSWLILEAKLP